MCHLCKTRALCERIARQVKNIDAGGAVSIDAIREILAEANNDLVRFHNAASTSEMILRGVVEARLEEFDLADASPNGEPAH